MMPRLEEIPFDSDRKLMTTKYRLHGVPTLLTKGALDVLLDRTTRIRTSEGIREMTEADREAILNRNLNFSEKAFASWHLLTGKQKRMKIFLWTPKTTIFFWMISMIDRRGKNRQGLLPMQSGQVSGRS